VKAFPPFRLDIANQCLLRRKDTGNNERVRLTPKAFAVLSHLVEHAGKLVTQDELLNALWPDTFVQPEVLKSHILDVRHALGDDAKHPQFIETLPKRGYQFIAPVTDETDNPPLSEPKPEAPKPEAPAPGAVPAERSRSPWGMAVGILAALILIVAITYAGSQMWKIRYSSPQIHSIAILPLQNLTGDPKQEYLADGMTEELTSDLGQISSLRVISRTSAMTYRNTNKKLPEIAHELGADSVVEGSVAREGNQVRISAQLINARTDRHIWTHTYTRNLTSVMALQGEVAQAIADAIRIVVTPQEKTRLSRARPVSAEAQELYLLGRYRLNLGDPNNAVGYFQKALEKDPDYAAAHAALADCDGWIAEAAWKSYSEAFAKQKDEATKAIELDEALPEGHVELAKAVVYLDWDWATADREYKRALELNPNAASILLPYSRYLQKVGRNSESLAMNKLALELDPVSSRSFVLSGFTYYYARQYDQALAQIKRARELSANSAETPEFSESLVSFLLGMVYTEKHMYEEVAREFQKSGNEPPALGHLGNAYARAGGVVEARAIISKLGQHAQEDVDVAYHTALVYAGLGEKDQAFAWLEKSFNARDKGMTYLKIDPCLDPLRSDPRFEKLLQRVGLRP
jgi:TolB-like protein/DNA-binding winged helix-turn-helix (wHTH) protein/lipoprotein NlpI